MFAIVVDHIVSGELTYSQARALLAMIIRHARKQGKGFVKKKKGEPKFLLWNEETGSYNYLSYTKV
jgi:hypothetical protein